AFDVPDLLADSGMIEHAIVNLLQNSIHALSLAPRPEITIKTFCRDDHIFLQIKDNGCGIPEIHLESIYSPSFSLKGSRDTTGSYSNLIKGTGYGMANVKKYIEQHRGSISVESEPGVGTQFTIQLPVINKELTVEEKKTIEERQIYPGQRILLVEDEVDISDVQYTILSDSPCNHQVDVAHNGRMALDLFDRNSYDLVSLDYILPGDINGMDIYHHIRRKKTEIPVLFTSGNLEFLQSIKDLKAKDKMIDHISKPCQNKEYLDQINKLLDRRNN
ncbi:MAG: ATP-binding protein, partial [Desulfobacterales bacterium]|nr:ATP-binding protein [Desulfobacterales bacterium]